MIELLIKGFDFSNAKTVTKILEDSGYQTRIVSRRDKYSHRWDTFVQIHDSLSPINETYIWESIMDSNCKTIKSNKIKTEIKESGEINV